ncbi:MAG: hypothetical protein QNJ32_02160 [Xenococcaceae cyanobacterium MO_167.B27]|nr:hypothetical protein [Xenococcaceae cyanobacterium MO_167.B27]
MIPVSNKQELEDCLAQCIVSGGLRNILAKAGIPESEPAKLNIKCVDIDLDVVKDYEIPMTSPQASVTPTETNCEQEIKDFLNQAETDHGLLSLLSALPKSDPLPDGTTRRHFDWIVESSSGRIRRWNLKTCCDPVTLVCRDC